MVEPLKPEERLAADPAAMEDCTDAVAERSR